MDSLNWDAVGAIGEILGAAAVVVTLIYLAAQTRQNTESLRHALGRGVAEDANTWRFKMIENPDLAELFREGLRDPDGLEANDRYRFRLYLDALVFHWQHAIQSGVPLPAENFKRVLSQPGGRWYWSRTREMFSPEFVEFIERELDSQHANGSTERG